MLNGKGDDNIAMIAANIAEVALIHVTAVIEKFPTVIPPKSAPEANPSCTKVLFRLSTIQEDCGASDTRFVQDRMSSMRSPLA